MILNEFDETKNATFDPCEVVNVIPNFPKIGVSCFSRKLIDRIIEKYNPEIIAQVSCANGKEPIYKLKYKDVEMAFFMSSVGAPACIGTYEEVFEMGLEKLVVFGTCGVLDSRIEDLAIIIPTSAVRDEGTSYHYMKASDEVKTNEKYIPEFIELLDEHNFSYVKGKVWTTDAIFRETRNKVLKRKEMGCICVDMECSAIFAFANFREKEIFQFFYAADNLDAVKWDKRSLGNDDFLDEKIKIAMLGLEMAYKVAKKK